MYQNVSSVKKSNVQQSGLDGMEDFDDASYEGDVYDQIPKVTNQQYQPSNEMSKVNT
jgi:hypothetical protein